MGFGTGLKLENRLRLVFALVVIAILTVVCVTSGGEKTPITATISEVSGNVQVLKASESEYRPAELDMQLLVNDQVLTGEDGRARINLSDGTIIRLSPLSNFVLTGIEDTENGTLTRLQLNIGGLWIIMQDGVVEVETPIGLASARGAYLHVWVDPLTGEVFITCLEGDCTLANDAGTVNLVAGQTAAIHGNGNPPEPGKMDHTQVAEWLDANPEATLVVVPLTATVQAGGDQPLPEVKTNTPTPTITLGPSPTPSASATPTRTLIAVDCGPPDGWVLRTVRTGETLATLSALYRVSEADLRKANCRGEMTFIVPGEKLFVPNVATSTPTNTPTLTPRPTSTPVRDPSLPTLTPTDTPGTMSSPVGPDNEVIVIASQCPNPYKITVKDSDGVAEVKLIWTFNGSLPLRDKAFSDGYYKLLPKITGDIYGVQDFVIETIGQTAPVHIRFRFVAKDNLGNVSYFPANDAFDLTDNVVCGDTAATFSNEAGPAGTTVTAHTACDLTFQIDVADPNGLSQVKVLYSLDGTTPTWDTAIADERYFDMINTGGDTYEADGVIDTSITTERVIKYVYAAKDVNGYVYESTVYSYTDEYLCGKMVFSLITSPIGITITDPLNCPQDYAVNVTDANGIKEVLLLFRIFQGTSGTREAKTALLLITPDGYGHGGIYALYDHVIDTSVHSSPPPYTIEYKLVAYDLLGNSKEIPSRSFIDNTPTGCVP